jgi:hypothetical protein
MFQDLTLSPPLNGEYPSGRYNIFACWWVTEGKSNILRMSIDLIEYCLFP